MTKQFVSTIEYCFALWAKKYTWNWGKKLKIGNNKLNILLKAGQEFKVKKKKKIFEYKHTMFQLTD